ncbi:MAG TPA: GAF domain-containing protein [Nocardioidaceae bacterium]|nr:GAF domain-containing protein [Nocardioidaceae bacterium]
MEPIEETRAALDLLTTQGDPEVGIALLRMGRMARQVAPACVGLSLGLLDEELTFTLVASSEEIAAFDAMQYLDGGPCVDGAHDGKRVEVDIDDIAQQEEEWLMYAQATAAAGIRSSLTLPVVRSGRVIGTVNLYGATADAFTGRQDELAEALGVAAGAAITNADLTFATRLDAVEAPQRILDQDDVDIALGMIARSQNVDIPVAQERLRQAAARAGITEGQAARAVRGVLIPD